MVNGIPHAAAKEQEVEQEQELAYLARGSNKEKSVVDLGRMPGTSWCGKGWRVDSAQEMGGYAGTDRWVTAGARSKVQGARRRRAKE